jgi:hypothetical protein
MKEDIGFKDYLLEVSMDVDLSDPVAAQQEIKRAARMAKTSPQRLNRDEQLKAKANMELAKADTGPAANIKKQIAQLQQRIVMLQQRLAQIEQMNGEEPVQ